jgi:hypothetical protein
MEHARRVLDCLRVFGVQRTGKSERARKADLTRPDEGEQLEHVIQRFHRSRAKARDHKQRVTDQNVATRDQIARFALGDLAYIARRRGEPCAAAGDRKRRQFQMRQTQSNLARFGEA